MLRIDLGLVVSTDKHFEQQSEQRLVASQAHAAVGLSIVGMRIPFGLYEDRSTAHSDGLRPEQQAAKKSHSWIHRTQS